MRVRILNVSYCILMFTHFCFGSIGEKNILETKVFQHEYNSYDSLNLRKGIDFIEKSDYDSARIYLLRSAESSGIPIKTESYLYLNFIETRLQNYDIALKYLEEYHKNAMLLFNRSLEIEDSVRNHKKSIDNIIYSIDRQNKVKLQLIIVFCIILLFIILLLIYLQQKGLFIFSKKKKIELKELDSTIQSKQEESQSLSFNAYLLQAEVFKQTPIYAEIKELEKQDRGSNIRVLTYEKQDYLQQELDRVFENFQDDLRKLKAKLSQNDIKLCCLSLLPINSFAKALCFGSTESNIIKQRKYYIKKKMTEESDNSLLFDFIFSVRKK